MSVMSNIDVIIQEAEMKLNEVDIYKGDKSIKSIKECFKDCLVSIGQSENIDSIVNIWFEKWSYENEKSK